MIKECAPLKILVVYGTRPEAIKMAPVVAALRRGPAFAVTVCATGQHREMLAQVQELLGLRPDLDLRLMRRDQTLNGLAAATLAALDEVLAARPPDWLLVQGDTTTAMAAALAAFHRGVRVGHVEAGLRTGDLARPFPEEANRRIVDTLAAALFAPTERAGRALLAEGCDAARVHVVGNTVIDALRLLPRDLRSRPAERPEVLITVHRRESFGAPLREIFAALRAPRRALPGRRLDLPRPPQPPRARSRPTSGSAACRTSSCTSPSTTASWCAGWPAAGSCSPTAAASRRRPPPSASRCWCCARPPSAPRGSRPASPGWWGPTASGSSPRRRSC